MLEGYISAGFAPDAFWALTPRLYLTHMRGARERMIRERNDRIEQAWLTAAIPFMKKVPKLSSLIETSDQKKSFSVAGQLSALKAVLPTITKAQWRARHGG